MEKKKILFWLLIVLALASRLLFLDLRPLHHDEGVNYLFAKNIVDHAGWSYDPLNYHGPFYFFVLALSFLLLGVSEFSLRLPAALSGIALAVLPLFLLKGRKKYLISVFLLFSPSLFYYSRYSIHESSFVLFSFLTVYFFSIMIEKKELDYLPFAAIFLALLFTVKETAIIFLFALFVMCLTYFRRIVELPFHQHWKTALISVFFFVFIYALLFTNFFTSLRGLADSFKAYAPWIDRGLREAGHDKPFYYYFLLLLRYELPLVLLGVFGLIFSWRKKNRSQRGELGKDKKRVARGDELGKDEKRIILSRNIKLRRDELGDDEEHILMRNIGLWFLVTFLVYSFIPYKTPWLVVNMTAPLAFLAGFGVSRFWERAGTRLTAGIFIVSLIYLFSFSFMLNFVIPWQPENQFAYVHTDRDILRLVADVKEEKILILFSESAYWPLPFYFDGREVGYFSNATGQIVDYEGHLKDYDAVIVQDNLFSEEAAWEYRYEKYRLREGVDVWVVWRKV